MSILDFITENWGMLTFLGTTIVALIIGWQRFESGQKIHGKEIQKINDDIKTYFQTVLSDRDKITRIETKLEGVEKAIDELKGLVLNHLIGKNNE